MGSLCGAQHCACRESICHWVPGSLCRRGGLRAGRVTCPALTHCTTLWEGGLNSSIAPSACDLSGHPLWLHINGVALLFFLPFFLSYSFISILRTSDPFLGGLFLFEFVEKEGHPSGAGICPSSNSPRGGSCLAMVRGQFPPPRICYDLGRGGYSEGMQGGATSPCWSPGYPVLASACFPVSVAGSDCPGLLSDAVIKK